MSNISSIRTEFESPADGAAFWITAIDKGLSDQDRVNLEAWLSDDPHNRVVFLKMAKLWDALDSLAVLAEVFPEPLPAESKKYQVNFLAPKRWAQTIAAALLIGVVVLAQFGNLDGVLRKAEDPSHLANLDQQYETVVGEQKTFVLPDGSRLELNTDSFVRVVYTTTNRLLTLERGEINIQVMRDATRPLSVVVKDRVVQAIGTEFNVEITPDHRVELVVTEGVVMIGLLDDQNFPEKLDSPVRLSPDSVMVTSNQQVVLDTYSAGDSDLETELIDPSEIAVRLSWRNGNLIFRGESLEEAVAEVGRYTAVEFIFLDEDAKRVRLAGMFRAGDVDGLLLALRSNFDIHYEKVANNKVLLGVQ